MVFDFIGKLLIGKRVNKWAENLRYANIKVKPYSFVGVNAVIGFLISFLISYFIRIKYGVIYSFLAFPLALISYWVLLGGLISLLIEQRARYVENVLPDILLIMASNLRSGIPTDESFILSARPEFGFLADKIKKAGNKLATGDKIENAIKVLTEDVKSKILDRTINMIIEGVKSGGELAPLLEATATDIRDNALLRKEISSMLTIYATFTLLAICIIAPVLYSVSVQLSDILTKMGKSLSFEFLSKKAVATKLKPPSLPKSFLVNFALINLTITGVFGSLMLGLINKGSEKQGLKYIPIILAISLILFYVASIVLGKLFGSIKVV